MSAVPSKPSESNDLADVRSLLITARETEAPSVQQWTCFHCSETFTTYGSARDHFGGHEGADAGCLVDRVAVEEGGKPERGRGLLMALRKAEDRISSLQRENEELENDSRLWHESEADRIRRIGRVQWWQELDYREGEKLVANERIAALESQLTALRQENETMSIENETMSIEVETLRTLLNAWQKRAYEAERANGVVSVGLPVGEPVDQARLAEFKHHMETEVIPGIVRTVQERQRAAAAARNTVLLPISPTRTGEAP